MKIDGTHRKTQYAEEVGDDWVADFMKTAFYKEYVDLRWWEHHSLIYEDLEVYRDIGRGAFGRVAPCQLKCT